MANEQKEPKAELDPRFSSVGAAPSTWAEARKSLEDAKIYWLSTVRPDGRPHVTSLFAVMLDDAIYFCTGRGERKAKNLAANPHCAVTTGCNVVEGMDLVVEGDALPVVDDNRLRRIADRYVVKYNWRYEVRDGAFYGEGGRAEVYQVRPTTIFAFGKGEQFSQTRWRFQL
jgi:uncharacterized pyridoxamine 5'-phosphate oxidase family protein